MTQDNFPRLPLDTLPESIHPPKKEPQTKTHHEPAELSSALKQLIQNVVNDRCGSVLVCPLEEEHYVLEEEKILVSHQSAPDVTCRCLAYTDGQISKEIPFADHRIAELKVAYFKWIIINNPTVVACVTWSTGYDRKLGFVRHQNLAVICHDQHPVREFVDDCIREKKLKNL